MKALCAVDSSLRDWPYPMRWRAVPGYVGLPGRRKVEESRVTPIRARCRDGEAVGVDEPRTRHVGGLERS